MFGRVLRMRLAPLGLALFAVACGPPAPKPGPAAVEARPAVSAAPVVVALVVDQLSAWVAEERVPQLPPDGFFARMRRQGTWVKHMRYPYAITDTAPGHAALHTGQTPNVTRILVNHNPDEKTGTRKSYFRDAKTKLVLPSGVSEKVGSSAHHLAAPTVADMLRARAPKSKIISVSLKDRAALISGGKHPDHALWYDGSEESFVTSTAIEPAFPEWARPIADKAAVTAARAKGWDVLDRRWAFRNVDDHAPGEGDLQGLGTTFPHVIPNGWAFRATPQADEMTLELALAGVKAEHDTNEPLLLLVSLSATDVIGHTFGPHSWEAWDHLLRLDRMLARFLDSLEATTGEARVLVAADHGNVMMPEVRIGSGCKKVADRIPNDRFYDRPCFGGHRLVPDTIRTELREEAARVLASPDVIAGVSDGYVFLSAAGRALDPGARAKLDELVARVLRQKHEGAIEAVFDVRELASKCPEVVRAAIPAPERARRVAPLLEQVCLSWAPDSGAGDYYVVPAHGSYFDGEVSPDHGTSHGTPHLYDRTVPLFVRGPGIAEGAFIAEPVDFTVYSQLEAALLGIHPGQQRTGDLLRDATASSPAD